MEKRAPQQQQEGYTVTEYVKIAQKNALRKIDQIMQVGHKRRLRTAFIRLAAAACAAAAVVVPLVLVLLCCSLAHSSLQHKPYGSYQGTCRVS